MPDENFSGIATPQAIRKASFGRALGGRMLFHTYLVPSPGELQTLQSFLPLGSRTFIPFCALAVDISFSP